MKVHYLQHVPFENLGCMEPLLRARGHQISSTQMYNKLYNNNSLPKIDDIDWLIVMGGPMGIFDEDRFSWLANEKQFIKNAIGAGKTVIGICLGAQLIANVLGAEVYFNGQREIGWFDINPAAALLGTPIETVFDTLLNVFHWHGDTFDIPVGAVPLASSNACANQGFIYKNNVVALQFHLETTPESANALLTHCAGELDGSQFVQTADEIMRNDQKFTRLNAVADQLLRALGA